MKDATRSAIKGYLEGFIQGMMEQISSSGLDPKKLRPPRLRSKEGDLKPFHEAILPDGILRIQEFERSFSTKLGTTFEEVARLIGAERFAVAQRGYEMTGSVSAGATARIDAIINDVKRKGEVQAPFPELIVQVVAKAAGDGTIRTSIADLYLKSHEGKEYFFEMKSPKPNKGQCLEATARLLQIHAIKRRPRPSVNAYFAMAYNPYGTRKEYRHSFALNYMDFENQVLVGPDFWELVGGKGAYDEVLAVYREVGIAKGPKMLDRLALGY